MVAVPFFARKYGRKNDPRVSEGWRRVQIKLHQVQPMIPITDATELQKYLGLVGEMTLSEENQEYHFNSDWIRKNGWKVVPVEDGDHFSPEQIAVLVPALKTAGYNECMAVATEPLGPYPACYRLSISEQDLRSFNSECGPFRYLLTDEGRTWAVSCNEIYNLFAGAPEVLEAMLGNSIEDARQVYMDFIGLPSMDPNGLLHQAASRYASL